MRVGYHIFKSFIRPGYQSTIYLLLFINWILVPDINNLDFTLFVSKMSFKINRVGPFRDLEWR